jgi:butyrate kinase
LGHKTGKLQSEDERNTLFLVLENQLLSDECGRVLVLNPGSTSTKLGVYTPVGAEWVGTIAHGDEELKQFRGRPMLARLAYRAGLVRDALEKAGYCESGRGEERFVAVAGRGGLLPPMECGTYLVEAGMVEELRLARRGEHACNLGALLALRFAAAAGVNAYIVDPVTVDEWQPVARVTGSPLIPRYCIGHALNTKAVARRFAREQGSAYEELRLIVIHMGSGVTVSAHRDGRTIDSNTIEEGPFGPDRSGGLPVRELIKLCLSGRFAQKEMDRMVFGDGGLFAYLGTRDLREVERRIDAGDLKAAEIFDAMVYQIAKEAGAMAAVLEGRVDALLITGGMAYSEKVVEKLRGYLEWIAPIRVYPGEDELQALAEGVFRVLTGQEKAKRLSEDGRVEVRPAAETGRLVIGME